MRFVVALLLLAALAGCLTPGRHALQHLDFRLRGKIAVRVDQEAFSASFDWRQAGPRYEIELWGPLGQGRTRLSGDDSMLSIADGRGEMLRSTDAAALMEKNLGWAVPMASLRHWVRGGYDPAVPAANRSYAQDGHLRTFEQLGWAVYLQRWSDTAIGPAPGRIIATQAGRRIVVVCRDWSLE